VRTEYKARCGRFAKKEHGEPFDENKIHAQNISFRRIQALQGVWRGISASNQKNEEGCRCGRRGAESFGEGGEV
jgi:hypothetical protein